MRTASTSPHRATAVRNPRAIRRRRDGLAVDANIASDDPAIRAEPGGPQRVGEDHELVGSRLCVLGSEPASEEWVPPERREKRGGHRECPQLFRTSFLRKGGGA